MKISRNTKKTAKKLAKAYLSWKAFKGVTTFGIASSLAYGAYRYFRGREEVPA